MWRETERNTKNYVYLKKIKRFLYTRSRNETRDSARNLEEFSSYFSSPFEGGEKKYDGSARQRNLSCRGRINRYFYETREASDSRSLKSRVGRLPEITNVHFFQAYRLGLNVHPPRPEFFIAEKVLIKLIELIDVTEKKIL